MSHSHITLRRPILIHAQKVIPFYFKWSSASVFSNRVPNWRHRLPRCIENCFWLWDLYPVVQGWLWGNESQSKMLINLHSSQTKAATNSFMYVDTIMNFGGILDGFWPIDNKTKCLLCDVRCKSKDGVTKFFTRLHYSIYKQSQVDDVLLRVTHHCIL